MLYRTGKTQFRVWGSSKKVKKWFLGCLIAQSPTRFLKPLQEHTKPPKGEVLAIASCIQFAIITSPPSQSQTLWHSAVTYCPSGGVSLSFNPHVGNVTVAALQDEVSSRAANFSKLSN